jgi:hypothetical protein
MKLTGCGVAVTVGDGEGVAVAVGLGVAVLVVVGEVVSVGAASCVGALALFAGVLDRLPWSVQPVRKRIEIVKI